VTPNNSPNVAQIDAYLDGILAVEERDEFARELSTNELLRSAVELQSHVDESLSRLFSSPGAPRELIAKLRQSVDVAPATSLVRRRWLKVASLAAAATIVWAMLTWYFFGLGTGMPRYNPNLPLNAIYEKCVADGFRPKWVCDDQKEFASTFGARQGQGLLLADLPAGMKMEGLTYCGGLSRYTTTMLARVDGLPVMVFVDRASADTHPTLPPSETKLHLFRKETGPLVIYELTPFDQPKVSDYLHLTETAAK
jgi:hypothetical protein